MARLATRQGTLARLGIGIQVLLTVLLALAAVLMINWLAARPGIRQRFDLTAARQNTLSTATSGVLDRLPGEVTIDVFFRPEAGLLARVADVAQQRTMRLLALFDDLGGERLIVRRNDLTDLEAIEGRKRELRLRGLENCLIVSYEGQREVVRLIGDLAVIDPGSPPPDYRPPQLVQFLAEEAIAQAILAVTRGEKLSVYFSIGHGELQIFEEDEYGMGELQSLLADEGLVVNRWSPVEDGEVPEDCACLSILRPTDPLDDGAIDAIEAYVRAGGRLVVAPSSDDRELVRSRLNELLARFELEVEAGLVCQRRVDPNTGIEARGHPSVGLFMVHPDDMCVHPLIDPLSREGRTFAVSGSHPVRFTAQPRLGVSAPVFTSRPGIAWVDAYPQNWTPDQGEPGGEKIDLAIAQSFRLEGDPPAGLEEIPEARVLLVGSAFLFVNVTFDRNYDFLRNAYNWALAREYRLVVSPRDPDLRLWPTAKAENLPRFNQFVWGWMPGVCLLLGLLTALWRARGAPKRRSS